jgi:aspartate racemase
MSWESSAEYYRIVNQAVAERLGGYHSARTVMVSVDFADVEAMQVAGDWKGAEILLTGAARQAYAGGADLLLLCTNTMHRLAEQIQAAVPIPLLHIADATAARLLADGRRRVGLLGTRYTMEQDFYRGRLESQHGLEILTPEEPDRTLVHDVIYRQLVHGVVDPDSKQQYLRVVADLAARGVDAVILGCTEIMLLIDQTDTDLPAYDTTRIHAEQAVEQALSPHVLPGT